MRSRNLKPGFFKNEILADCEPLARILFAGLWCLADREGRLEYRPKRIKAELLPYDNVDILKLLDQLNMRGFIVVYKIEDEIFLEIPAFTQHQNPNVKESASNIPALCQHSESTVQVSPLSSFPFPLTDSPLPLTHKKRVRADFSRFEDFWSVYPKKKSKGDAEKAWANIKPDELLIEKILSAVQRAKTSDDWLKDGGKYVPYPASWLNKKGWEDEYTQGGLNGKGNNGRGSAGQFGAQTGTVPQGESRYPVDLVEEIDQ